MIPQSGQNPAWMANSTIQSKKISELILPGTHDSGSYSLTDQLSIIEYPDISFLWDLNPGNAPTNGNWPWAGSTYNTGQPAYNTLLQVVMNCARSQGLNIYDQLLLGIRYFDLRVYFDPTPPSPQTPNFYVQHGLKGTTLEDILQQVIQFIQFYGPKNPNNPQGKELIFLELSHTNFQNTHFAEGIVQMLEQYADYIYMPPGMSCDQVYSCQDFTSNLSSLQLSDITGSGSKIVLLNTDIASYSPQQYYYSNYVITTNGFANSNRNAAGTDMVSDLESLEQTGLQGNNNNLYRISWTLTVQAGDALMEMMNQFTTTQNNGLPPRLNILANEANYDLANFLTIAAINQNKNGLQYPFNLITVDWCNQAIQGANTNPTVVDIALQLNAGNYDLVYAP